MKFTILGYNTINNALSILIKLNTLKKIKTHLHVYLVVFIRKEKRWQEITRMEIATVQL